MAVPFLAGEPLTLCQAALTYRPGSADTRSRQRNQSQRQHEADQYPDDAERYGEQRRGVEQSAAHPAAKLVGTLQVVGVAT